MRHIFPEMAKRGHSTLVGSEILRVTGRRWKGVA
jgi:hypothetical protein